MAGYYDIKSYEKQAGKGEMEDFIKGYSKCYLLENGSSLPGFEQSRKWIEKDIEKLLYEKEKYEPADAVHILAWKMGRIDHKKSAIENIYLFTGGDSWSDKEEYKAKNRSGEFDVQYIIDNVQKTQDNYPTKEKFVDWIKNDSFEALKCLSKDFGVKGIGSVYIITLLFFLSGGEFPIYDEFAMRALLAIDLGKKPGEEVKSYNLPDKGTRGFYSLIENKDSVYNKYINLLEKYFGDEYKTRREIDQALWVYGHYFRPKAKADKSE